MLLLISAENDPLQLRPNPENLISKVRPEYFIEYIALKTVILTNRITCSLYMIALRHLIRQAAIDLINSG